MTNILRKTVSVFFFGVVCLSGTNGTEIRSEDGKNISWLSEQTDIDIGNISNLQLKHVLSCQERIMRNIDEIMEQREKTRQENIKKDQLALEIMEGYKKIQEKKEALTTSELMVASYNISFENYYDIHKDQDKDREDLFFRQGTPITLSKDTFSTLVWGGSQ